MELQMANILIKKPVNTNLKKEREELNEFMSQYNFFINSVAILRNMFYSVGGGICFFG